MRRKRNQMMMREKVAVSQMRMRPLRWKIRKNKNLSEVCLILTVLKKHRNLLVFVLTYTVPVNDGEEGEATLLQFRAKLYTLESKEQGWKERGVGTLKLNANKTFVDYYDDGTPILGSFDPSARDENDGEGAGPAPVAARLIMRQENTHRVILNTVILKAQKFEEKTVNSAVQILFTAFEDTKLVNMLLKVIDMFILLHCTANHLKDV
jgi:hypothetical protein